MMIRALLLLFMFLGLCGSFAEDVGAMRLTPAEQKEFKDLDGKDAPEGFVDNDGKTTYAAKMSKDRKEKSDLEAKKSELDKEIRELQNQIKLLDGDIDFFSRKIDGLEHDRSSLSNSIFNTRNGINQFNKAVMDYVSEQLNNNAYIVLGIPAFARKNAYSHATAASKLLVVNNSNPASDSFYAVGGELVTSGMGKAQFVVLHRQGDDSFAVEKAGNEIEINEADKDKNGDFFKKKLLFTDNFVALNKDDLWGIVIDAGIGLRYDSFDTGSSYVVDYNGADTVKLSNEHLQGKTAFSFSLFVQAIDK